MEEGPRGKDGLRAGLGLVIAVAVAIPKILKHMKRKKKKGRDNYRHHQ